MNPFLITGYKSPEFFCDRKDESERLTNSLLNRRNVTLFSRRRIGKTALIHHTFYKLKSKKQLNLYYLDLYSTNDIKDFIEILAKAIFTDLDSGINKLTNRLKNVLGSLRPTITYDQFTGNPVISFNWITEKQSETTLENIFNFLNKQKKEIIIAFDEFQQIVDYPQKNIEALLRTHIQNSQNITCIFSGSQDHLITSMFKDKSKPFYHSSELFHLEKINPISYEKFILSLLRKGGKTINKEHVVLILNICENNTYFVQYLCNRLYSLDSKNIDEHTIYNTLLQVLKENEPFYFNYRNLLTANQWYLLSAIAKENGIQQITSKDFIKNYNLNTPSSVKAALDVLLKKGLVYYGDGIYELEDIFFKIWLQRT